ncbi:MAG: S1C family serine protease [Amaricoccus sp.]|uniref:S1C family serine protease n=1 Tax=Amaricoccus sp. TaxID=1872485 RepID=UPI0039E23BD7
MPESSLFADLSRATTAAVAAAAARVVAVRDGQGRRLSGIVWGGDRVVTAEECLSGDDGVTVVLPDGRSVPAGVAGRDPTTDVVVLKVETGEVPPVTFAASADVGALALVAGRGEEGPLAALAMVAASGPAWTSAAGGRIDAMLRLGLLLPHALEGGAVVDAEGRLLGLAVADPRRRALVIPAATVARSVEAIATRGHVGRGYLGLGLRPLGGTPGLMVIEVTPAGPAADASLLLGDIVTTWEGEPVGSMRAVSRRLGPESVGREVRLGVIRAGEAREIRLSIGERRHDRG